MVAHRSIAAPSLDHLFVDTHRGYNRNSANSWEEFAEHRSRITSLACETGGERIAVLGAGNCNDLDLTAVAAKFGEIHLVDIDDEALRRARDRQPDDVAKRIALHAPVDLSGALDVLPAWREKTPTAAQITDLAHRARDHVTRALPTTFDVVVSACLLSQIMHTCRLALGSDHDSLVEVGDTLARAHLCTMVRLVRPGGRVIFISDTCSSEMYPPLETRCRQFPPLAVLGYLDEIDNVLSGTRPSTVFEVLRRDPAIASRVAALETIEPWLWAMAPFKLLVYAFVIQAGDIEPDA